MFVAAAAVLVAVPYLAGVLVPYYVNGLHHLPLSEVASGLHDPKDLWPQGTVGGLVQLGGYLAIAVTPMCLIYVGLASGVLAVRGLLPGRAGGRSSPLVVVLCLALLTVACAAAVVWLVGPTGLALATWRMD